MICCNCMHQSICAMVRQLEEQQKEYLVKIGMSEPCEFFMDKLKNKDDCDYCCQDNGNDCSGSDHIYYDKVANRYYLIAEHYQGEIVSIEAKYCLECGRELKEGEAL